MNELKEITIKVEPSKSFDELVLAADVAIEEEARRECGIKNFFEWASWITTPPDERPAHFRK